MRFRKRPLIVEAEQFFDSDPQLRLPPGICACGSVVHGLEYRPHVHTLEGPLAVSKGDWIVCGVEGEFYPIKDAIFRKTYAPVVSDAPDKTQEKKR